MAADFAIGSLLWPGTSKVLEEAGELIQVLGKLQAVGGDLEHWDGDLHPRLVDETADLGAALRYFSYQNFSKEVMRHHLIPRAEAKYRLFLEWHAEELEKMR